MLLNEMEIYLRIFKSLYKHLLDISSMAMAVTSKHVFDNLNSLYNRTHPNTTMPSNKNKRSTKILFI